jgi:hypothetical protein
MRSAVLVALVCALSLRTSAAPARAQRRAVAAPAPRRAEPVVPFKVGETLSYDVSWTSFLVAGSAVVSVKEKKPSFNSTAYYIVAVGRPIPLLARFYALYYKMDTLVDSYGLLSQRGSLYAEEGKEHRTSITRFDRPARRVFFEEDSDTTTKLDYAVPPDAQDGLSTLYSLRTRAFKIGDPVAVSVADSGGLYRLQVTVGAPEQVSVPFGSATAWNLKGFIADAQGQPVWNNISIWISNDARRLPLKMQAELPVGAFVLALRNAQ